MTQPTAKWRILASTVLAFAIENVKGRAALTNECIAARRVYTQGCKKLGRLGIICL
jgi:hypothetical protein